MEKLKTINFRKHPGGLRGFITTFKILFFTALCIGSVLTVGSLVTMFSGSRKVEVISKKVEKKEMEVLNGNLQSLKTSGNYEFRVRNPIDWLLFDNRPFPNFFICVFSLLITWQSYKIFEVLKLDTPFSLEIAERIRWLGLLIIAAAAFSILQDVYCGYAIKSLTAKVYKYRRSWLDYSIGYGLMILIIAEIYRRGCELQEDRDLTV